MCYVEMLDYYFMGFDITDYSYYFSYYLLVKSHE